MQAVLQCPSYARVIVFNVGQVQELVVIFQDIRTATRRDPVLSMVFDYVFKGWPKQTLKIIQP